MRYVGHTRSAILNNLRIENHSDVGLIFLNIGVNEENLKRRLIKAKYLDIFFELYKIRHKQTAYGISVLNCV